MLTPSVTIVPMYHTMDLGRCRDISDDDFIAAFEALTLKAELFRHADHVRLAFVYLQRLDLLDTLRRYADGLRRFAAHHGASDRYHETVTWALVILIHERMASYAGPLQWPVFAADHSDFLRWKDGVLFDYYGPEILESDLARRTFLLPGPSAPPPPLPGCPGGRTSVAIPEGETR